MNQKNTACPDCGTSQVNHASEYATVAIEQLFAPFEGGLNACWNLIHKHAAPLVDRFMPHVLNAAVAAGFARRLTEPDPIEDELLLQCLWAEAKKRDITIYQYALKTGRRGICVAYHNGVPHYFERLPRPKGPCSKAIHWMDDKSRVKEHVLAAGLPAARGGACFLFAQAEHFFRTLEAPFVVKPHTGSATRHTTMNIHTLDELRSAFAKAKQLSPLVMVEEQLVGPVYRITLIGGKVAGVIRRDQPQVVADGVRTVRALWEEENKNPKRHGWVFSPIAEGEMVDRELERQGYTWQSVPPTGTTVFFHPKINWGIGGTTTNCTDSTHPENMALFEKIGTVVNDPLVGIDFLIEDISKPHSSQKRYGVIEANSLPFIDNHHLPFNGEPRNVAGALLDLVFPEATA